jgi:NADP-dependent 3-hydroxy acid dehydrogenase YdfG
VGAISEGLQQDVLEDNVQVTVVEPGAVETELPNHITTRRPRRA